MTLDIAERYLAADCHYDFWLRPGEVPDLGSAQQKGLNCVVLAHLALKDLFGYTLPPDLRCTEMFLDTTHFTRTDYDAATVRRGDLLWFGTPAPAEVIDSFEPSYDQSGHLQNWQDFPVNHVGVFLGKTATGEAQILHSAAGENTAVWSLEQFGAVPRYQQNWGMSRLVAAAA